MGDRKFAFDIIMKRGIGRTVRAGLTAAGLSAALAAAPAPARADDFQPFGDAGVFVGYTWGEAGGITWGIEGRAGVDSGERGQWTCGSDAGLAAAAVARIGFVDLRPTLHFGGQVGVAATLFSGMLDVGLGYRFGENGGVSLPIGFELQVFTGEVFLRGDPLRRDVSLGAGLIFPGREGGGGCAIAGRALHDDAGHAPLPGVTRLGEIARPLDLPTELADLLALQWEERAKAEWASVPAFLQLADQLRRAGAPALLVRRAIEAADDELRHAVGTARAALCYGGAPLQLGQVTDRTRAPARGQDALVRLAVESFVDGSLGEGRAAAAARCEATQAELPAVRGLQSMIADDESRHAELAWDVLAWTVEAGGDDVRHALHAVRDASPAESSGSDGSVDLGEHGLLSRARDDAIGEALREQALPRLDALLA